MKNILKIDEIERKLETKYIGRKIIYTETTISTNNDAKKSGELGEAEGLVFISENQTCGRGRVFRQWVTVPLDSIAMTILLKPNILPSEAPTITPILAVSVVEAIREITDIDIKIKWPNDIFVNDKKVGGILTEMNADINEVKYIVVGIGLNVNQEIIDDSLINIATSLKLCSGKVFSREELIAGILNRFEVNYEYFIQFGLKYFGKKLRDYSSVLGKEVIVISGLEMIEGVVLDIDDMGNLILGLEDGRSKKIIYGDVSLKCKELLKA